MNSIIDIDMKNIGVDTIIRCHDPKRLMELDRALFSLLHQSHRPVHPIVVAQGFRETAFSELRALVEGYHWKAFGHVDPTVVNVDAEHGKDIRAHLLNVGSQKLTQRYFAILDSDDYLYGTAYEHLINEISRTGAAIAFGNISRKDVCVFDNFVYTRNYFESVFQGNGLQDLVIDNFCPIHSFVVDRTVVASVDIYFDETLNRLEDYEFLLRICTKYPSSFESRSRFVGTYNWHLDGRASNQFSENEEKAVANRIAWNNARRNIWRLKCQLRDKISTVNNNSNK